MTITETITHRIMDQYEVERMLLSAHQYLDQFGPGHNLEYIRARHILQGAILRVHHAPKNRRALSY